VVKRRRILLGTALFAWMAMLPPSGATGLLAAQGAAALGEALQEPLAILADRAPGARGLGALLQSKTAYGSGPSERVLSPVLDRPASPIPADLANLPNRVMDVIEPGSAPAGALPATPGSGGIPLPIPPLPGGSGGAIPPGTGTPPGTGDPSGPQPPAPPVPPPPSPPVVSDVPEPSTWLMMIVGVGLIGLQLRRRRASTLAGSA
jgi:hypothetical protein